MEMDSIREWEDQFKGKIKFYFAKVVYLLYMIMICSNIDTTVRIFSDLLGAISLLVICFRAAKKCIWIHSFIQRAKVRVLFNMYVLSAILKHMSVKAYTIFYFILSA